MSAVTHRVSFASEVTVLGTSPESDRLPDPGPVDRPDIQIYDPVDPSFPEEDPMDVSTAVSQPNAPVIPPPPGFECFVWLEATGEPGGDPSVFDFSAKLPGWYPLGLSGASDDQLPLPLSPILSDSPEGLGVGGPATSPRESDTPSGTGGLLDALCESPPVNLSRLTLSSSSAASTGVLDCLASQDIRGSPGPVPRWRLAREGPFLSERSPSSLNCFGDGCSFRHTTYRPSDYTRPSGRFGASLHHPRFL